MHLSRALLAALLVAFIVPTALAQNSVGPLVLDPAFANGGKSEIDFGADSALLTCYSPRNVMNGQLHRIVVAGKVFTGNGIKFGIAEYDSSGAPESGSGTDGIASLSWMGIDYPTALLLLPNGKILATGIDGEFPAFFRLNSNCTPDSSFGDGRVSFTPFTLLYYIQGELQNLDTLHVGSGDTSLRYLATGAAIIVHTPGGKDTGFYAARITDSGYRDLNFGSLYGAFVPAPVVYAQGHLIAGNAILFAGVTNSISHPDLLLCKLRPNGLADSSFGTNGVLNTNIAVHGTTFQSLYDPDSSVQLNLHPGLVVCAPVTGNLPFTILKFKLDGTLDSSFGINGYATAQLLSNMTARGLNLSNDGSILVSGSVGNVSAAAKFFSNGVLDTSFGTKGLALLDADSGGRTNYLIGFVPAPLPPSSPKTTKQRFLGIGASANVAGAPHFLLARYMPTKDAAVNEPGTTVSTLELFPNPARDILNVNAPEGTIKEITVTDELGRTVRSFERPGFAPASSSYIVDLYGLANGVYNCSVRTTAGVSAQQFTLIH